MMPISPTASAASCPKCWVASGPSNPPESTQFCARGARVETCNTQFEVLQVRDPQVELKLSHATAMVPSGAITAPSKLKCGAAAIVLAALHAPPAGRTTAITVDEV